MRTLNLGILAHVDAGKTSLTERVLHAAGVIDHLGSVDAGSTQTDALELERRRGITIKSAVAAFTLGDVAVNLIDTPGHPDFIAEVERVLGLLDGAVLVVSAVEGVQAQTRVLLRTLRRLGIPTLLFVNKTDRRGARIGPVLDAMRERLTPAVVPMGTATRLGTPDAAFHLQPATDPQFRTALAEALTVRDDGLLAAWLDELDGGPAVPQHRLRRALRRQTRRGWVHPVYLGSAATGAGVPELLDGVRELLPAEKEDPRARPAGTVFKVERGAAGERIAYVRMYSGALRAREPVPLVGRTAKPTAVRVFVSGADTVPGELTAGRIGKVWGLGEVRIGDVLGTGAPGRATAVFAPPTLESVVVPLRPADRGALHLALSRLAEQDPLIGLRQDERRGELSVSLYGEVQKEVLQTTLAEEFGVDVEFRRTTTLCIERPRGTGEAVEFKDDRARHPHLATVGLRVEPAPVGSGVEFRLGVELGSMPYAFFRAVEDTVHEALREGNHGWGVTDCLVTMTHSGYYPRQSHAHAVFDKSMSSTGRDFRLLTPMVLEQALRRAGTTVQEPVHRFRLELPADLLGSVLPALAQWRAVPESVATTGVVGVVEGEVPAAEVHGLRQQLPGLTRGEGDLESAFARYQPVHRGRSH